MYTSLAHVPSWAVSYAIFVTNRKAVLLVGRRATDCFLCAFHIASGLLVPLLGEPIGATGWTPRGGPRRPLRSPRQRAHGPRRSSAAMDADLTDLCRRGRLFAVQAWIDDGKPIQWRLGVDPEEARPRESALEVARQTGQHSLCEVLLSAVFRQDEERHSPFSVALRSRRPDLVDLLSEHGPDPRRADPHCLRHLRRCHQAASSDRRRS